MRALLILILFTACNRASEDDYSLLFEQPSNSNVVILPVEDQVCNFCSLKVTESLTTAVLDRLKQKRHFSLENDKKLEKQFLVQMRLIDLQEIEKNPPELAMSIHVKILDTRGDKPKVILQEVFSVNTLLEEPLNPNTVMPQSNEKFRISPMGLTQAKLSRKIADRIEDYTLRTN